jgi:hypothetical protein
MTSVAVGYARKAIRSGVRFGRTLARAPLEREAKRFAGEAIGRGSGLLHLTEDDGLARFRASDMSGAGASIPALLKLAEGWKSDPSRIRDEMPRNILKTDDLFQHRAIIDLAVHDDILAAVTAYFGQVPRLYNLMMWWSPPNQAVEGSRLYHYDHRDNRQAKVFINLTDVTEDNGPLHFLSPADSLKVDAKVGYSQGRYTDEDVYTAVSKSDVKTAVGEAGRGFIVDTGRCLHYGSRGNRSDRFILLVSFARVNSVNPGKGCRVLDPVRNRLVREFYDSDPVRAAVIDTPI